MKVKSLLLRVILLAILLPTGAIKAFAFTGVSITGTQVISPFTVGENHQGARFEAILDFFHTNTSATLTLFRDFNLLDGTNGISATIFRNGVPYSNTVAVSYILTEPLAEDDIFELYLPPNETRRISLVVELEAGGNANPWPAQVLYSVQFTNGLPILASSNEQFIAVDWVEAPPFMGSILLSAPPAVPEPGTWALLAITGCVIITHIIIKKHSGVNKVRRKHPPH